MLFLIALRPSCRCPRGFIGRAPFDQLRSVDVWLEAPGLLWFFPDLVGTGLGLFHSRWQIEPPDRFVLGFVRVGLQGRCSMAVSVALLSQPAVTLRRCDHYHSVKCVDCGTRRPQSSRAFSKEVPALRRIVRPGYPAGMHFRNTSCASRGSR